jgi:hypothetical protein
MPLSIAHGNGIKNFHAVTKIDAALHRALRVLSWGAQAASLLLSATGRKASAKIDLLSYAFFRRQAAGDCRLAAAPRNLTRSVATQNKRPLVVNQRTHNSNVVCAD